MKKGITLGLVLCLCMVMLAGCGEGQKDKNPLAVYKNGKEVASVGMTLEEAEKKLGKRIELKQEINPEIKTGTYEGIKVKYSDNVVDSFTLYDDSYSDYRGVKVGMPTGDLTKHYTEDEILMTIDGSEYISPCHVLISDDGKIIPRGSGEKNTHQISVSLTENKDNVKAIVIF